jgi:hypothetical protein
LAKKPSLQPNHPYVCTSLTKKQKHNEYTDVLYVTRMRLILFVT